MRGSRRNPSLWLALIILVACLGIGSRRFASRLPGFVAAYAGDTLWALAASLGFGLVLPRSSTLRVALLGLLFSIAIEVSQLYHAPWIDSIRRTIVGGLLLGYGFVWSDLACYAVGVGLGVVIEYGARSEVVNDRRRPSTTSVPDSGESQAMPD